MEAEVKNEVKPKNEEEVKNLVKGCELFPLLNAKILIAGHKHSGMTCSIDKILSEYRS